MSKANKILPVANETHIPKDQEKNITVLARVRPLNEREIKLNSSICVSIESNVQILIQKEEEGPKGKRKIKKYFTFDGVYGMNDKTEKVYERAKPIVKEATQGINTCIFAYGQTGAGKTYTMEGTDENPGIMYRFCNDIFEFCKLNEDRLDIELKASYLEIYNNNIIDLLAKRRSIDDYKIREDKLKGIYVTNLVEYPVRTVEDVKSILQRGSQNRTVGETNMNKVSSRSHGVLTLYMEQKEKNDEEGYTQRFSKMHLIDLAGSERQKDTGVTGTRLKEGAGINQSLSTLGGVINALVKNQPYIPYRDSKLTRLLQDSIGGNAMTILIVNLSPATINFEESLSTLQFADRAKQIKNKIKVNMDPKLRKIAELMRENQRLKRMLSKYTGELAITDGVDVAIQCDLGNAKCKCCTIM